MLPSLFIAHGSPMVAVEDTAYAKFLEHLGRALPRPRAIAVFSAHWTASGQWVSAAGQHQPMYDFAGFPASLYQVRYAPAGDPALAEDIVGRFGSAGVEADLDYGRKLDHGVWTILNRLYPDADVPVVALSVNPSLAPGQQYAVGRALSTLRESVLIVGSGVTTHNFNLLAATDDPDVTQRVLDFESWLAEHLKSWDLRALEDYERRAPNAAMAVPPHSREHFIPLLYAMGASDDDRRAHRLYHDLLWNVMTNSVYQFGGDVIA